MGLFGEERVQVAERVEADLRVLDLTPVSAGGQPAS
jgi:hypothetical protein